VEAKPLKPSFVCLEAVEEDVTSTHDAAESEMLRVDNNAYVHGELIIRRKKRLSGEDQMESRRRNITLTRLKMWEWGEPQSLGRRHRGACQGGA
jgi:hypothetical protein